MNRVELIGRLGADAEIVTLTNGTKIAKLRVSSPSELLPRVVEHVKSNPRFLYERLAA